MKKVIAFLLVTVMALSLFAGCGGSSSSSAGGTSSGTGSEGNTRTDLKIAMGADPGTMDPYASAADGFMKIRDLVYQPLCFLNDNKQLDLIIAEKYEEAEDGLSATIKIKENVYDSKGNHITADDILYSFQKHVEGNGYATWKYNVEDNRFEKVDEYTVKVNFKQRTCYALWSILTSVSIVSKTAYEEAIAKDGSMVNNPVGTGPYTLENWIVGSELSFTKYNDFWMAKDGGTVDYRFEQNMDTVVFKIIAESAQRAIELETGGVDFIFDAQASDYKRFSTNDSYVAVDQESSTTLNIYFNCSQYSNCQDKRMRQAIAYALDSHAVAVAACEGYAKDCMSIAGKTTMEWRDEYAERDYYKQDLEKSKALVAELKADGKPTEFTIMTDENAQKRAMATVLQEACKQVGITCNIDQLESAVFQSRYGDMTAWDAYAGRNGANIYQTAAMTTQIDRTGYEDPSELRNQIAVAFEAYDEEEADKVVALWDEEIPILPIVNTDYLYCYAKGLVGCEHYDINNKIYYGHLSWE